MLSLSWICDGISFVPPFGFPHLRTTGSYQLMFLAGYLAVFFSGLKKTTGASVGTLKGVADFGSRLNFENIEG